MKIRLTIEIDLPDAFAEYSPAELNQFLSDAYVNFATCKHRESAIENYVVARIGTPDEDRISRELYEYHKNTADWTQTAVFTVDRLDQTK